MALQIRIGAGAMPLRQASRLGGGVSSSLAHPILLRVPAAAAAAKRLVTAKAAGLDVVAGLAAHNAAAAAADYQAAWPAAADAALPLAPLAALAVAPTPLYALSEGLEAPIQLIYLLSLLGFLAVGAYLVVRQVLVRRELDEAAKALGERIRTGAASCEDYYELGVILTRKKLFTQATKNLEKAKKVWDGDAAELAQVHNALGFCYFQMAKYDACIAEYEAAVGLQQGYVTAWNNLGDAYEATKQWRKALEAYQTALSYAPNNKVASSRGEYCRARVERLGL